MKISSHSQPIENENVGKSSSRVPDSLGDQSVETSTCHRVVIPVLVLKTSPFARGNSIIYSISTSHDLHPIISHICAMVKTWCTDVYRCVQVHQPHPQPPEMYWKSCSESMGFLSRFLRGRPFCGSRAFMSREK